jgi:hypothetical protein
MKNSEEQLSYSDEALLNRVLYYYDINDINFFFEDSEKEYEYETILNRLFNNNYNISTVFCMGGKPKLKEAFNQFGSGNKKNVYIADADFDFVLEKDIVNNDCFIYLDYYNIENYYIDKMATHLFMKGDLRKSNELIEKEIDFDNWYLKITKQLYELFLIYIAIQKNIPEIKNVSRNPYLHIDCNTGFCSEEKFNEYYLEISEKITDLEKEIKECDALVHKKYGEEIDRVICGKYYFQSLYQYVVKKSKGKFNRDTFKWALICNFDISKLETIKNKILKLIS